MLVDPRSNDQAAFSILIEATGNGVATKYNIDSYRTMTLDQFKAEVAPTLKSSDAEKDFSYYVIRDLSRGNIHALLPDGAIEYKVSTLVDVPADNLLDELQELRTEDDCLVPKVVNSPFPVYSYAEKGSCWKMFVKIPETRFRYKHPGLFDSADDYPFVYMPPVVFGVYFSGQIFKEAYIKVLAEDSLADRNIKFGMLPLPNVWTDSKICMGGMRVVNSGQDNLSKSQLLLQTWDLFLNGNANEDLLHVENFPENIKEVFEKYATKEQQEEIKINRRGLNNKILHLKMFLVVLSEPGRWEELQWRPM